MKRRRTTGAAASEKAGKTKSTKDEEFLEAAASLTTEDVDYVRKHARYPKETLEPQPRHGEAPPADSSVPRPEDDASPGEGAEPVPTQEHKPQAAGRQSRTVPRGKRAKIEHQWPEAGTVLEADYFGKVYTAEVIEAPAHRKVKSGKLVRVTSGPAAGTEHASMSGAMEAATERQRNEEALGRKGCLSGWEFWKWPGKEVGGN